MNVPVMTYNELEPAQKLQTRLQQAGIPASIHDESNLERFWFMTDPLAAIHVEVPEPHYLPTRNLISKWESTEGLLHDALRCPECLASRIEFPQLPRKFMTPTLFRLAMAVGAMHPEFYCMDCHYTCPTMVQVPPKLDILGFPYETRWSRFRDASWARLKDTLHHRKHTHTPRV